MPTSAYLYDTFDSFTVDTTTLCVYGVGLIMPHTRFRVNLHFVVDCMSKKSFDTESVSSNEFLDIQEITQCRLTLKHVCDMVRTCC